MNEKFRLMKNPLGELLCVVIDNNKDAGTYMYEPEYASEQEAFTKNPVAYSYLTVRSLSSSLERRSEFI